MLKRGYKLIISVVFVATLLAFFGTAYADPFAGAVSGAMSAMGVTIGSSGATAGMYDQFVSGATSSDPLGDWTDPLGEYHVYYKNNAKTEIIEGQSVDFDLVWYSPDFAKKFQDEGIAFLNDYSITSDSSDIIRSGSGYVGNIPIFGSSSQVYVIDEGNYAAGPWLFNLIVTNQTDSRIYWSTTINGPDGNTDGTNNYTLTNHAGFAYEVNVNSSYVSLNVGNLTNSGIISPVRNNNASRSYYVSQPFDFNYVSGIVDATPITSNLGLQIYIPHGYINGIADGTYSVDGGSGDDSILVITEGVTDSAYHEDFRDAEWSEGPIDPPVPTPTPVPVDTPLGDVPYDDFIDTFGQSVYDRLDSIEESVDTVGQSVVDGLSDIEGAIDTAGQSVVGEITNQGGIIKRALDTISSKIDSLVNSVDDILEAIITHPLDLFGAFLDRLTQIPVIHDLFDGIKQHVGIWHYVVEWLQCICSFLTFFIGLFSDVAYCMVVPIYACVAGAICLAFYKRFGR